MQYTQRKLHRSVTLTRRSRSGRLKTSSVVSITVKYERPDMRMGGLSAAHLACLRKAALLRGVDRHVHEEALCAAALDLDERARLRDPDAHPLDLVPSVARSGVAIAREPVVVAVVEDRRGRLRRDRRRHVVEM